MGIRTFRTGQVIGFDYTNHRNETSHRLAVILGFDFGTNEWYPEPQWFMRCYDLERQAHRSFALNRIDGFQIGEIA